MGVAWALLAGCGGQPRTDSYLGHDPRFGQPAESLEVVEIDETSWTATLPNSEDDWHTQEKPDYCWAACMQSVMSLQGHADIPSQFELWERFASNPMFNDNRDAATFEEICFALAPEFRNQMPGYFVIDTESTRVNDMVRALASGEPVIVGLLSGDMFAPTGHAYVLYAMDYTESEDTGRSKRDWLDLGGDIKEGVTSFLSGEKTEASSFESKDNTHTAIRLYMYDPNKEVLDAPEYGGGKKIKPVEEVSDAFGFALSPVIARRYLQWRTDWLRRHDQGPGIYVVDPIDRDSNPLSVKSIKDL